jgi:uncharacterized membrane protein
MPKLTVAGHPAHPQLVTLPIAFLPYALVLDVLHLATGEERFADAADLALTAGVAGAAVAGAAGALDYAAIPREHRAKGIARLHGGLNLGVMGLFGANLWLRRGSRQRLARVPTTALSLLGSAALLVSSWYGAHLVYEHGLRVEGQDPLGDAPELTPPGDTWLERLFRSPIAERR